MVALLLPLLGGCRLDASGINAPRPGADRIVPLVDLSRSRDVSPGDGRGDAPITPSPDRHAIDARPQLDQPACPPGLTWCGSAGCVDLQTHASHCGSCGHGCDGGVCSAGICCAAGLVNCGGVCADLAIDVSNCGACGKPCAPPATCVASACKTPIACAAGSEDQAFQQGMRGCKGTKSFADRASLCAAGFRVCTAAEWVARRGGVAPTYNYWTNDVLYAAGYSGNCIVTLTQSTWCDGIEPMRVCAGYSDPLGNDCNWINCGYNKKTPHDYLGGCEGNNTAGAICCPK
jgi:hypothetical protein